MVLAAAVLAVVLQLAQGHATGGNKYAQDHAHDHDDNSHDHDHDHDHAPSLRHDVHVAHVSRNRREDLVDSAAPENARIAEDVDGEMTREDHDCATHVPEDAEIEAVESELRVFRMANMNGAFRQRRQAGYSYLKIQLVFHIIHDGGSGMPTLNMLNRQMAVLNEAYSGSTASAGIDTRIRFEKKSHRFIDSSMYAGNCRGLSSSLRATHAYADSSIINVFTCPADGYLGWAYLPWQYSEGSKYQIILIHPQTMPGGSYSGLNLGDTLVHEMGHYLGLLHTFAGNSGSCDKDDKVDDTPLEATPNYGCSAGRDTCPNDAGLDPIWSFMDYSKDACMNRFSAGQVERMRDLILAHRPQLKAASETNWDYSSYITAAPDAPTSAPTPSPTPLPTRPPTQRPPTVPPPTPPPPTMPPTTPSPTRAEYLQFKFVPSILTNVDRFDCIVEYSTNAEEAHMIASLRYNGHWYGGTQTTVSRGQGTILMSGIAVQGLETANRTIDGFNLEIVTMPYTDFFALSDEVLARTNRADITVMVQEPENVIIVTTSPPETLPPPTPPPPTIPTTASCEDSVADWQDRDGDSCDSYVSQEWCTATGDYGPRWGDSGDTFNTYSNGGTAVQVCCGCGGGTTTNTGGGDGGGSNCPPNVMDHFSAVVTGSKPSGMSGIRMQDFVNSNAMECAVHCAEETHCKAFVFHNSKGKCALLSSNAVSNALVTVSHWDYYERIHFDCSGTAVTAGPDTTVMPNINAVCNYCMDDYYPVCSPSGVEYRNPCYAICNRVTDATPGVCSTTTTQAPMPTFPVDLDCPYCMREYVPVCSRSGHQYYNPCYAMCHRSTSYQFGLCPPGTEQCPYCVGEYMPVCGQGESFYNPCYAHCKGIHMFLDGLCSEQTATTVPTTTTTTPTTRDPTPSPTSVPTPSPTEDETLTDCHCAQIDLPVCSGSTAYMNPCYAFCDGQFGFEYGACPDSVDTTTVPQSGPDAPMTGGDELPNTGGGGGGVDVGVVPDGCISFGDGLVYEEAKAARLRRTRQYTIGGRIFESTLESCATACDNADGCVSFEFSSKRSACELKNIHTIVAGMSENDGWVIHELSDDCQIAGTVTRFRYPRCFKLKGRLLPPHHDDGARLTVANPLLAYCQIQPPHPPPS